MAAGPVIREGGLDHPAVAALLRRHLAEAHGSTPRENAHALGIEGLRDPAIRFWTAWHDNDLAGFVALKTLEPGHGEVKSMRTHPDHLRCGIGRALLVHVVAAARAAGHARLSLETGTAPSYRAANALYEAFGFVDGPVFGGYPPSSHNRFMTLTLESRCPRLS